MARLGAAAAAAAAEAAAEEEEAEEEEAEADTEEEKPASAEKEDVEEWGCRSTWATRGSISCGPKQWGSRRCGTVPAVAAATT